MKKPLNNPDENPQGSERSAKELALVEAALYVAGRPLNLSELCSVLRTRSKNKVKTLVKTLMQEYASRNTALEILELKDERYVLQLKAEFTPYVKKLVKRPLLSTGPLKTLSYIALRQPVPQKRVVEVRGRHAYGHIKLLKDMGLIASERKGRSTVLKTTDYFADYFGLSHDVTVMKRELRKILEGERVEEENTSTPQSTENG
ncbi:MAG: SMC-Scp complex subunit ScpB [Candidatus Bathyarchaeia archaeon]